MKTKKRSACFLFLLSASVLLFSVFDASAQIAIDSPKDGMAFTAGDVVAFSVSATGGTGAAIESSLLAWSSSIDGKIGKGNSFTKSDLSVGKHTITVKAPSTNGGKISSSIRISITPVTTSVFPGTIIIGRPTDNSIAVNVHANMDLEGFLEYGIEPGVYSGATDIAHFQASKPVEMTLDSLSQNTKYYYRMQFRKIDAPNFTASAEISFHTQRKQGSIFVFTVQADPHVNDTGFDADIYNTTLNNVRADAPDFHIDLGDTFLTEKTAISRSEVTATFTDHLSFFALAGSPLFLVNGNHEGELGWLRDGSANNPAVWSCLDRRTYYPTPKPGDFYSGSSTVEPITGIRDGYYCFTWGDALFVMLDPFWYTTDKPTPAQIDNNWNWTLGREQYDWFKHTIETSTAHYKFVFVHHLLSGVDTQARGGIEAASFYEWGGKSQFETYGFYNNRPGWGKPIHQILQENHATIVFHGHDHVFVKQEMDGIVYQECSRPSFKQADAVADATAAGYVSGEILPSPGYLRVQVTPALVKVEYVRTFLPQDEKGGHTNGEVAFTYTLSGQ